MNDQTGSGILLDENTELSLTELCAACSRQVEWVVELVEEGVLEPSGAEPDRWRFPASALERSYTAMRLHRDLGVNVAGIALALDLLDEVKWLRTQNARFSIDQ